MKLLVKYEFLKIVRKKSTLAVLFVSLLVTAFLFGLPVLQFQTYNQDGLLKGLTGIAYEKEQYKTVSVRLTDTYTADIIHDVKTLFENPDNVGYDGNEKFLIKDAYWKEIAPREELLGLIASVYVPPGESAGYNSFADFSSGNFLSFSEAREQKIKDLLNTPSRELSEEQKEYWSRMNDTVKSPFQYGYHEGWEVILTAFELLLFPILAVCIVTAPVFSGEYQAGTDALILSARYGKTKLIHAKLIASLLFALTAFTVHIIVAFGIPLAVFGFDGWNLPVQILGMTIPYPFTIMQTVLISLGIVYIVLLAMTAFTLFLSAKMKSPYLVLIVIVPVLFVPIFFSPDGTGGIYNLTLFLFPYQAVTPAIGKYLSYQTGSLVWDSFSARAVLYAAVTLVMLPLAGRSFKEH